MTESVPLPDVATELRVATFRLARRLRCVRPVAGMSDGHLAVLYILRMHGRQTLSALAERERVTAPAMTYIVNALEELGAVVRTPDEADRRRVHVEITAEGDRMAGETLRRRDELLVAELGELELSPEEIATLHRASALMRRIAER